MLKDAYDASGAVRETFAEASEAVGYDMWSLIQTGEQSALNMTETTQPVLLASSVALWRAWVEQGGAMPALMAGHSLGEFTALVCAGALGFADAVSLVRQRGAFMQTAVPVGEGAMAAIIGLDDATINETCEEVARQAGVVAAVNFNSPGQVVIAGEAGAVEQAIAALKVAGAKRAMPLPVSAPFHTSMMKPAGEKLAEVLSGISLSTPMIPVVHNVHAGLESDVETIRSLLVEQIYSPVQWTRCVETMVSKGVSHVVECGPGKVLSGLNRRIDKSLTSYNIEEPSALAEALASLSA
ncbi:malonyl CoA-acyl carrier protein transacylase [Halioglobus pacificus]|uniref:Malonyl CoA-acyl carrier protein transacylase n=2 Tax=Parahalioglobus pacificus TaxID=930806 RepID=A0A918XFU1_9GAMM|nr:malonyl CoA-acyl carrier protein transacylase [Halioglobus pacificus]